MYVFLVKVKNPIPPTRHRHTNKDEVLADALANVFSEVRTGFLITLVATTRQWDRILNFYRFLCVSGMLILMVSGLHAKWRCSQGDQPYF